MVAVVCEREGRSVSAVCKREKERAIKAQGNAWKLEVNCTDWPYHVP